MRVIQFILIKYYLKNGLLFKEHLTIKIMKTYKVVLVITAQGKIWSKGTKKNKNVKLVAICDINLKTKNKDSRKFLFT